MNRKEMISALAEIRDQLVRESATEQVLMTQPHDVPVGAVKVVGQPEDAQSIMPNEMRKVAQSQALQTVLVVLDGWIESAHENHQALDHQREPRHGECWTQFAPSDFRNMINDAACDLGISAFPRPKTPKEDEVR